MLSLEGGLMDDNFRTIPFGRFKNRLAFEMAADYAYVAWIISNPKVTTHYPWVRALAISIAREPGFVDRLIAQTNQHMNKAAAVSP